MFDADEIWVDDPDYPYEPYPDTDSYCPKCEQVLSRVTREMPTSPEVALQTGDLFYIWVGSLCNHCGWTSQD